MQAGAAARSFTEETVAFLKARVDGKPRVMVVLGSGLGDLGDQIEHAVRIPFAEIPGFAASAVEGHKGLFVAGQLEGVDVVAFVLAITALGIGFGGLAFGGTAYREVRALREELERLRSEPGGLRPGAGS